MISQNKSLARESNFCWGLNLLGQSRYIGWVTSLYFLKRTYVAFEVYGPPNKCLKKPPRLCGGSKDSA